MKAVGNTDKGTLVGLFAWMVREGTMEVVQLTKA